MYIIVFREGILSVCVLLRFFFGAYWHHLSCSPQFHFRPTPHPLNVRRRIKQLKDYISVTSDWISYALIDDITDAFGPLIQSIEYEVDSIDELVLILKETEQSDMLRRIGTCRKKVMGLLRLMGNKADVVKGLAKRCNENWRVAPTSDIVRFSLSTWLYSFFLPTFFFFWMAGTLSIGYSGNQIPCFIKPNPFYSQKKRIIWSPWRKTWITTRRFSRVLIPTTSLKYLSRWPRLTTRSMTCYPSLQPWVPYLFRWISLLVNTSPFFVVFLLHIYYYFRFMGNERTCSRPRCWGKVSYP